MKTKLTCLITALALLASVHQTAAQGTAFTYQGQLFDNTNAANGNYAMSFTLYGDSYSVTVLAGPTNIAPVVVNNGLFTVLLDFGPGQFTGSPRWLQIAAATNSVSPNYLPISPRQLLSPAPYAIFAGSVGTVSAAQLTSIGNTSGGVNNFFIGLAGNSTTSGNDNTANGFLALNANNAGNNNTANGLQALYSNTDGNNNTANGFAALQANTGGNDNTANGYQALFNNNASFNVADGYQALFSNTTGTNNTASGVDALYSNTTGSWNTASGIDALYSNTTGTNNTANGVDALFSNTTGYNNTANGFEALQANMGGNDNTANGYQALFNNHASFNMADGYQALFSNTAGFNNVAVGYQALYLNTTGNNNIALGLNAGLGITTGNYNIDVGNVGVSGDNNIIRIGDPNIQTATYLAGTVYANNVALTSDRNVKENFTSVNNQALLAKVVSLPVTQWNFKQEGKDTQHIGPMAQDFYAAFNVGPDDKHIAVVDEGGVALAAIQGLNQKVDAENAALRAENADLKQRLEKLERLMEQATAERPK